MTSAPAPTTSPTLLVLASTISVPSTAFVDLLAGQSAPEPSTCVVPPMTRGGVAWDISGQFFIPSGTTRQLELQASLGGVVFYRGITQAQGSNADPRTWRMQGRITRRTGEESEASLQMFCTNSTPGEQDVGLGFINAVGTLLSPAHALGGLDLAATWDVAQRLMLEFRWTAATVADTSFSVHGGAVWLFS